jgi:hypothetical protein
MNRAGWLMKIFLVICFFFYSFNLHAGNLTDQEVLGGLLAYLEKEKENARICLDIEVTVDSQDSNFKLYDVIEIHNDICGGDPETFPRYGLYRAENSTGGLYKLDFISGEYQKL